MSPGWGRVGRAVWGDHALTAVFCRLLKGEGWHGRRLCPGISQGSRVRAAGAVQGHCRHILGAGDVLLLGTSRGMGLWGSLRGSGELCTAGAVVCGAGHGGAGHVHEPHGLYSSVGCQQRSRRGQLLSWCFLSWSRMMKSHHGCTQASPGDAAVRLQLAEREQALLLAQETIQVSPPLSPQPSAVPVAARRDRLPLPLQPSCDATAQRGVCSVLSTS